jgi:protein-disulfide isomerase
MAVAGSGAIAGIGFTVSLLIASLAFSGTRLAQAKLGVLAAAVLSSMLAWLIFKAVRVLPPHWRAIAMLGRSDTIVDLADPVDPERDHIRGPADALVTLVEYGDLECPYCGRAEPVVRELLAGFGDLRYVWRHLPLTEVHPHAQLAAEATEAAGMQAAFWPMHDLLFEHQDQLTARDLPRYAAALGLDVDRFANDLRRHAGAGRVARDVDSADVSGVTGTPTFFVNGRRHHGAFDIDSLAASVRAARARAIIMS